MRASSDIAPLIQEIVDRPGWASGNAIAVLVTGSGERVAESFDGDPGGAPLLRVEYAPPANLQPVVTISAPALRTAIVDTTDDVGRNDSGKDAESRDILLWNPL